MELSLRAGMPLFRAERLENASLWMGLVKRGITAEYLPVLGLSARNGSRFSKQTKETKEIGG